MQKVERRNHPPRRFGRGKALLLCALLLILSAALVLLLRPGPEEEVPPTAEQRISGAITQRAAEELRSLTITRRGEESWTLVQDDEGELHLEEAAGAMSRSVDERLGERLRDAAVNLTYEDVFTEDRSLWADHAADFGLADPLLTAVFRFTDGDAVTARIGDSADLDENAVYYMTVDGDDRLFAVSAGTVQDLNVEKAMLRPVDQLTIHAARLDRISVREGDGSLRTEWRLQGDIRAQDAAENWLLTAPFVYAADYDAMKNLRDSASSLILGAFVADAEEKNLPEYGLDYPSSVIELHMAAGSMGTVGESGVYDVTDWPESTVTLTLGNPRSEMVDYVLYEGKIYTISHFSVATLTEIDPMSTVARYLAATPLNSLESLLLEREGEPSVYYSLIHVDTETNSSDSGDSADRCMRNGEEIPYDTFTAAYERLLTVTVSGRLPANYEPKDTHTKYTFRTVSGGTHTVELSDFDGMHDAVTLDGQTHFYLIRGGMTELP